MLKLKYLNTLVSDSHLWGKECNPVAYFSDCFLPVELLEDFVSIHLLAVRAGSKAEVAIL